MFSTIPYFHGMPEFLQTQSTWTSTQVSRHLRFIKYAVIRLTYLERGVSEVWSLSYYHLLLLFFFFWGGGIEFFLFQKSQGLKLPLPIAHLTFQNLRCVQYSFDNGNYIMDNPYTFPRRWWGMVSPILSSCCQFVENILFSSLIYSWHIFGNKLILTFKTVIFIFLVGNIGYNVWKYFVKENKHWKTSGKCDFTKVAKR